MSELFLLPAKIECHSIWDRLLSLTLPISKWYGRLHLVSWNQLWEKWSRINLKNTQFCFNFHLAEYRHYSKTCREILDSIWIKLGIELWKAIIGMKMNFTNLISTEWKKAVAICSSLFDPSASIDFTIFWTWLGPEKTFESNSSFLVVPSATQAR